MKTRFQSMFRLMPMWVVVAMTLLGGNVYAGNIPHLVLQWNMEEGSGTVLHDVSGNGNDGSLHGGGGGGGSNFPIWDNTLRRWPGAGSDWSLKMNADGGVILDNLSAVSSLTEMTIECWVYEAAPRGDGTDNEGIYGIVGPNTNGSPFGIRTLHAGNLNTIGTNAAGLNNFPGTTPYTYGQWHHIATVISATQGPQGLQTYMDGNLESEADIGGQSAMDVLSSGGAFFVGAPKLQTFYGDCRGATIDEIRVWDVARSAAELQPPTASWSSPPPPNRVDHWTLYGD